MSISDERITRVHRGRGIPARIVGLISLGPGDPGTLAQQFLHAHAAELGLAPDLATLTLLRGHHVIFRQVHRGLPVFGATVTLHISPEGELLLLTSDYHPDIPADGA